MARQLVSVPPSEFNNHLALETINAHPGLFIVDTPIHVDNFEKLLVNHPNHPFIDSVIGGLRNGFWPWADTHFGDYPDTLDEKSGRSEKSEGIRLYL